MGLRCDLLGRRTGCTHTHTHTHSLGGALAARRGDDQDLPGLQCAGDGGCGGRRSRRDAGSTSPGRHQRQPAKRPGPDHLPTKVCSLGSKQQTLLSLNFTILTSGFSRRARIHSVCCHITSLLLFSIVLHIYRTSPWTRFDQELDCSKYINYTRFAVALY